MLVSDLIKFREIFISRVEKLNLDQSVLEMSKVLHSVILENAEVTIPTVEEKINDALMQLEAVHQQVDIIRSPLINLVEDINQTIDKLADELLIKSDQKFKSYHKIDFNISKDISTAVRARIHHCADWHFPGMHLGCRTFSFTNELVANDPLYLCDSDSQYINEISSQFNDIYSRRLRKYVIDNHDLSVLPHNQFGFIFSWMMFNYTDFAILKEYLRQIIILLRPGGTLMLSYNNGDLFDCCRLSEQGGMSWIPKRHLVQAAKEFGYELIESFDLANTDDHSVKFVSWIELRKPGQLSTIKRSQAQGLIEKK